MPQDVFEALEAEQDQLEETLGSLDPSSWVHPSRCDGWTDADVVLHLAQTEEAISAVITGGQVVGPAMQEPASADERMDLWVAAERGASSDQILNRWQKARRAALDALRVADPGRAITWVAAPLKPRTFATTRLSEHWIHAHDVADPLRVSYPDTDRLWHICRLAHRMLPYAFSLAGRGAPPDVYLELISPTGETWSFGPEEAQCTIRGPAQEFCRVAARRLSFAQAVELEASGEGVDEVLRLVRTYA